MFQKCDRCPAQAVVRYTKPGEQPWQWCADHATLYADGLDSQGWVAQELIHAP